MVIEFADYASQPYEEHGVMVFSYLADLLYMQIFRADLPCVSLLEDYFWYVFGGNNDHCCSRRVSFALCNSLMSSSPWLVWPSLNRSRASCYSYIVCYRVTVKNVNS